MNDPYVSGLKMTFVGALLGVLFFGGLWITLQKLPMSKRPYLLTLSSVLIRTAAVLVGIWYFSAGDPVGVAGGLAGFFALQLLATRRAVAWRDKSDSSSRHRQGSP